MVLNPLNDNTAFDGLFEKTLPQALLFLGPEHARGLMHVNRLIMRFLCDAAQKPCQTCRNCHFFSQHTHPDVMYVQQEKPGAAIKVDQIRALQQVIYQTPQCASYRVIVIEPADELNRAAANALLKIVEEPPKHVIFMLIARHLNTIPATLVSRCQKAYIPEPATPANTNVPGYLTLGLHYDEASTRGMLFKQYPKIIQELCDLSKGQGSVCQLAALWSDYTLNDCLWFFQLLLGTLLKVQLLPEASTVADPQLKALASRFSPVHFFKQLDMILKITRDLNQDIPLNPALALETLLMGYT